MATIPCVEATAFVESVRADADASEYVHSIYLFGSASYDDFIIGYSDVDLFIIVDGEGEFKIQETIARLKRLADKAFSARNVDFSGATLYELKLPIGPFNPFLLKEISIAKLIFGKGFTYPFNDVVLREDSLRVSSLGLRMLRGGVSRISRMNPLVAVRFVDETLFKSTKALLLGMTGKLYSARSNILCGLEREFPNKNSQIYRDILALRIRLGEGRELDMNPVELLLRSVTTFQDIWTTGIKRCII